MRETIMAPDALAAIAGMVEREWGASGYRFESVTEWGFRGAVGTVVHSDGSRFAVASDRWGNTGHGDTPEQAVVGIARTVSAEWAW
jgi:hypothetical protein